MTSELNLNNSISARNFNFDYQDSIKSQENEISFVNNEIIKEQENCNALKQQLNSYMEENDFNNLDENIKFYTNMLKQYNEEHDAIINKILNEFDISTSDELNFIINKVNFRDLNEINENIKLCQKYIHLYNDEIPRLVNQMAHKVKESLERVFWLNQYKNTLVEILERTNNCINLFKEVDSLLSQVVYT